MSNARKKMTDIEINWIVNTGREMDYPSRTEEWDNVIDEYNAKFGRSIKSYTLKRYYQDYKEFDTTNDFVLSKIKQHRSMQLNNTKVRKENRIILDKEIIQDQFIETFTNIIQSNKIKYHPKSKLKRKDAKFDRVVVGHISDTHIGAEIDGEELGGINKYTCIEEARRHAFFFQQLVEYKPRYRDRTELVLFLNGDLMQGVIHDQEDAAEMTTQFARALSIYIQGITFTAQHYKKVRVICTTGNHARFMHKSNKGRVSSKKWDGFHTMLHVGIKTALREYNNVEVFIPSTPYAVVNILGHNFFATHGDTVLNVGNVSKTINISNIASQINDINAALTEKVSVVMVGHVHKATYQTLDSGVELVINGPLSGTDSFAQSIGILHSHPCQQIFECTPSHAVGDMRFVRLKDADKDKKLDKIIKPLTGKF